MNTRQRVNAILHYEAYDKMPIVHFGYWTELLQKWHFEGHIDEDELKNCADGNEYDQKIAKKLGFDFCWTTVFGCHNGLMPAFEHKVLSETEDGYIIYQNGNGLIEKSRPNLSSIPTTIDTLLKDRKAWDELYLPKLSTSPKRCDTSWLKENAERINSIEDRAVGLHLGSLYGSIRDMLGVEALSYLQYDDEELYIEIINTIAEICYENTKLALSCGVKFDFGHFWEDICFKNGPLVSPLVFEKHILPHYRKIADLLLENGIDLISLDCDGCIDELVPIWLKGGVNVMFPIEVGTWNATISPWRKKYGKYLRGVGGVDKRVFAYDYNAVDKEIERLKPLIESGGYIPCPDHRLPPETIWENVQYYCDRMKKLF